MLKEVFTAECVCGKPHILERDGVEFTCECGRPSLLDWGGEQKKKDIPVPKAA